jgi:hypothetical protein
MGGLDGCVYGLRIRLRFKRNHYGFEIVRATHFLEALGISTINNIGSME